MEVANCQLGTVPGTPNGIRPIMMMGDVNGMMLVHTAKLLPGLLNTLFNITKEKIIGMVMGSMSACASSKKIKKKAADNHEPVDAFNEFGFSL